MKMKQNYCDSGNTAYARQRTYLVTSGSLNRLFHRELIIFSVRSWVGMAIVEIFSLTELYWFLRILPSE